MDAQHLCTLDALSERLWAGLELDARLQAICDFFVPERAQWLLITLFDPQTQVFKVAAVAHRNYAHKALMEVRLLGRPYGPKERGVWKDNAAAVMVPMAVGLDVVGTIHAGLSGSATSLGDVLLTEALGTRCARALRDSQRFEAERRISRTFQTAALATALPRLEGFTFDAVYEAGLAEALVGGDWYDAFRVDDGRIVLSIGDVAGSGLGAAVTMMNVRQAIRGVAQVHPDPGVLLAAAERTLRTQHEDRLVTSFVAVIDPITQQLSYANAGHPPALLRESTGNVRTLGGVRAPLGLSEFDAEFKVWHVSLPPGSLLLLYTDGLIESTKDVLEGESLLRNALAAPEIALHDGVARAIHDRVLSERSRDDVAILAIKVEAQRQLRRWRFDPIWDDAARRVRKEAVAELQAFHESEEALVDFEMIFSELLSNALRYAPGTIEVILERETGHSVLHVLDNGPGYFFMPKLPHDLFSEFGRGLFLVSHLALDFSVERRPGGGSHARVIFERKTGETP